MQDTGHTLSSSLSLFLSFSHTRSLSLSLLDVWLQHSVARSPTRRCQLLCCPKGASLAILLHFRFWLATVQRPLAANDIANSEMPKANALHSSSFFLLLLLHFLHFSLLLLLLSLGNVLSLSNTQRHLSQSVSQSLSHNNILAIAIVFGHRTVGQQLASVACGMQRVAGSVRDVFASFFMQTAFEFEMKTLTGNATLLLLQETRS